MSRRARISRTPDPPPVKGIRAGTLDGLLAGLAQCGVADPVVADLSLGEWRSHELARSCFAQLEIPWPLPAATPADPAAAASAIGDWIDSEGRGDTALRIALGLAETLFGALGERPLALVVLAPRFGRAWQAESAAFLRYLAQGIRPTDRLILVGDEHAHAESCATLAVRWSDAPAGTPRPCPSGLLAIVPGAIDPATAGLVVADGHPLRAGWKLVPPEWRRVPTVASRLEFDRLAAAPVDPWLRAFAQVHGNNGFVDPWFLCSEANLRLAEGSPGIGLQLLDRAVACARSLDERATLSSLAQGFRIALMRYDEAAVAPDPSHALPPYQRGALHMTKGWGLAMTGKPQRAEEHLRSARELLEPVLGRNRQFLYLLNISALNRVNLGDVEGALALEKQIEAESAGLDEADARFDYVNFINIARLHRRRNEFDLAAAYYERAFATTAGARTESDLIYTNVCAARLEAARGRPLEAFQAWLRASLHWLSCDVPEALGWRVQSAVLGRKALPISTSVDDVAEALAAQLRSTGEAAASSDIGPALRAVSGNEAAGPPPVFLRTDRDRIDGNAVEAIGAPGFSVFATRSPGRSAVSGPFQHALASLVTGLIAAAARTPALVDFPTILVDDGVGQEMPVNRNDLLAACLRLCVRRARFDGVDCEFSPDDVSGRAIVRYGPAVARLHGDHVHFKRYLPLRRLSAAEAEVMAACERPVLFSVLSRDIGRPAGQVLALVRELEAARVLEIKLEVS
jgi:tetratricopeptide (TPR) repeat protein